MPQPASPSKGAVRLKATRTVCLRSGLPPNPALTGIAVVSRGGQPNFAAGSLPTMDGRTELSPVRAGGVVTMIFPLRQETILPST